MLPTTPDPQREQSGRFRTYSTIMTEGLHASAWSAVHSQASAWRRVTLGLLMSSYWQLEDAMLHPRSAEACSSTKQIIPGLPALTSPITPPNYPITQSPNHQVAISPHRPPRSTIITYQNTRRTARNALARPRYPLDPCLTPHQPSMHVVDCSSASPMKQEDERSIILARRHHHVMTERNRSDHIPITLNNTCPPCLHAS